MHITRGVLQDGIIQRPQVKILPLDSCRVIEYNDFVEVSVVDSKSGKILFATKDREEYAKYREKKMLKLPMHAWFSFGEFGVCNALLTWLRLVLVAVELRSCCVAVVVDPTDILSKGIKE